MFSLSDSQRDQFDGVHIRNPSATKTTEMFDHQDISKVMAAIGKEGETFSTKRNVQIANVRFLR